MREHRPRLTKARLGPARGADSATAFAESLTDAHEPGGGECIAVVPVAPTRSRDAGQRPPPKVGDALEFGPTLVSFQLATKGEIGTPRRRRWAYLNRS